MPTVASSRATAAKMPSNVIIKACLAERLRDDSVHRLRLDQRQAGIDRFQRRLHLLCDAVG
jgi:hypothetical protein